MAKEVLSERIKKENKMRFKALKNESNGKVNLDTLLEEIMPRYEAIYFSDNELLTKQKKKVDEIRELLSSEEEILTRIIEENERQIAKTTLNLDDVLVIDSFEEMQIEYERFLEDRNTKDHTFEELFSSFAYNRSVTIENVMTKYEIKVDQSIYFRYFKEWYNND